MDVLYIGNFSNEKPWDFFVLFFINIVLVLYYYSIVLCYSNFLNIVHVCPPFMRKRIVLLYFGRDIRTRSGVAISEVNGPSVFHIKTGVPVKCLAQGHNQRTCQLVLHNIP